MFRPSGLLHAAGGTEIHAAHRSPPSAPPMGLGALAAQPPGHQQQEWQGVHKALCCCRAPMQNAARRHPQSKRPAASLSSGPRSAQRAALLSRSAPHSEASGWAWIVDGASQRAPMQRLAERAATGMSLPPFLRVRVCGPAGTSRPQARWAHSAVQHEETPARRGQPCLEEKELRLAAAGAVPGVWWQIQLPPGRCMPGAVGPDQCGWVGWVGIDLESGPMACCSRPPPLRAAALPGVAEQLRTYSCREHETPPPLPVLDPACETRRNSPFWQTQGVLPYLITRPCIPHILTTCNACDHTLPQLQHGTPLQDRWGLRRDWWRRRPLRTSLPPLL